jgi:hypothetical protein
MSDTKKEDNCSAVIDVTVKISLHVVHEIENNSSLMHILVLDKGLSGSVIVH